MSTAAVVPAALENAEYSDSGTPRAVVHDLGSSRPVAWPTMASSVP